MFTVGRLRANRPLAPQRISFPVNGKSLRVLVVEDHPAVRTVVGMFLVSLGHQVELAKDIVSALAIALDGEIDALLTDVVLPGRNGWELCHELSVRGYSPPLMISMSAFNTGQEAARSREAGCHAHLNKPFDPEELATLLQKEADIVVRRDHPL